MLLSYVQIVWDLTITITLNKGHFFWLVTATEVFDTAT